jgi:hypothetical protein
MSSFDDHVNMPIVLDDYFYSLLQPYCAGLTFACVEAAWEAVVGVLATHAEREALDATREAVRDA